LNWTLAPNARGQAIATFKSYPEKAVQRDIDAATSNRERLSSRLAESEQAVARHAAVAKQSALTGDDAELDRSEISLRAAQDRSTTLRTALTEVDQQLEAMERKKAEIADQKVRSETAAEIEPTVRSMTEAAVEFNTAAARLSEHTARALPWLWEVRGLNDFVNVGRAQVPSAVDMVATMLRAYAEDVMAPATSLRGDGQVPAEVLAPAQQSAEPAIKYQVVKESMYKGFPQCRGKSDRRAGASTC
jgi:hypothetical protein